MANKKTNDLETKTREGADDASKKVQEGADEASKKVKEGADKASKNAQKGADEANEKIKEGADYVSDKVKEGAKKVEEAVESEDFQRAAKRAEEEVNRLKSELADIRRNVGPKIQEAENFLTSPSAVTFYKGLITGVAIVLAFKKYSDRR
ncbi:unnamed protein product [Mucor hiemalis]